MIDPFLIYIIITIGAVAIALILTLFGFEDIDFDIDGSDGLSPLSPIFLLAFFAVFGMSGSLLEYNTGIGHVSIVFLSTVIALPIQLGFWKGFHKFVGNTEGEVKEYKIIGVTGVCTTAIPKDGVGQVTLDTSLGAMSYPARSNVPVKNGQLVKVMRQSGTWLIVEKIQ